MGLQIIVDATVSKVKTENYALDLSIGSSLITEEGSFLGGFGTEAAQFIVDKWETKSSLETAMVDSSSQKHGHEMQETEGTPQLEEAMGLQEDSKNLRIFNC